MNDHATRHHIQHQVIAFKDRHHMPDEFPLRDSLKHAPIHLNVLSWIVLLAIGWGFLTILKLIGWV